MSNFLTLDETVSFCLTTCKTATAEDRLLFRVWCVAACRSIGPNRDWYKTATIYPKDFSFKKPDDLVSTVSIALYDSSSCEVPYIFHTGSKRIHQGRFTTDIIISDAPACVELSEDANYYHLSTNADTVAAALIRYLGMPVDVDGFPMVPEDDLLAYECFCQHMWAKREKNSQSEIAQTFDLWLTERNRIKGNRKMPSMVEAEGIFSRYLSLINAPTFKQY